MSEEKIKKIERIVANLAQTDDKVSVVAELMINGLRHDDLVDNVSCIVECDAEAWLRFATNAEKKGDQPLANLLLQRASALSEIAEVLK